MNTENVVSINANDIPATSDGFKLQTSIEEKLDQLQALISVSVCEDFSTYNTAIQQNYMLACEALADQAKTEFNQMCLIRSYEREFVNDCREAVQ